MRHPFLRTLAGSGPAPMQLVFDTSLGTTTIALTFPETHNITVDWGDGTSDSYSYTGTSAPNRTHTYAAGGIYTVKISGTATRFGQSTSRPQLTKCLSFGDLGLTSLDSAFYTCANLTEVPSEIPATVTSLENMFREATSFNHANITSWNTSAVTDMSQMFQSATAFNQNIGSWNTGAVTTMQSMFYGATAFNQNIGSWNTGAVTTMREMFFGATAFNGNISGWNTGSVTTMQAMFQNATAFNQNIGSWNTAAVTNMAYMFRGATAFNQNIGSWNTGAVTTMYEMFYGATAFNQNIGSWNTGAVTTFYSMFRNASAFNQNIGSWNTAAVTDMAYMFQGATSFNQNIGSWNTSAVKTLFSMFDGATAFNQNIGSWNTGAVTSMNAMFQGATAFNQNIGSWNTAAVLNMGSMFNNATAFNQNIGSWNTAAVSSMSSMFNNATAFNQNLTNWSVGYITTEPSSFRGGTSGLSAGNVPVWGSAPALSKDGEITYVGVATGTDSATLPTHQSGDLIIAFATRDGDSTTPSLVSGWTNLTTSTFYTNIRARWAYKIASSSGETTGTWTNATRCAFVVYRNTRSTLSTLETATQGSFTNSTTITYPTQNVWKDLAWTVAFAVHRSTDATTSALPSGLTLRSETTDTSLLLVADSNASTSGWSSTSVNIGGTSSTWTSLVLRLRNKTTPAT